MTSPHQNLLSETYLRAVFDHEFKAFLGSPDEKALREALVKWAAKGFQKETSAESAFINVFFETIWGYVPSGKHKSGEPYTCYPKFPIAGAGQLGGTGEADAALAIFGDPDVPTVPQVLCEFKDVRSNLDAPQKRKGNTRSPVKQCADYLREAMKPLFGNEAIQPTWGIVTDMNEFRLYWRNTMPSQYQRFIIKKATTDSGTSLLDDSEAGSFQRFLFVKLLHRQSLLSSGPPCALLKLLKEQRYQEREIETLFYREYSAYRARLVSLLIKFNPKFKGTKGQLVRLAQKLIDRCIFVMFCEDMGEQLSFPPNALRDYLAELSKSSTFEAEEQDAWHKLKELFEAMNEGKKFRSRALNKFNGGLFAADPELENLIIPNEAFCAKLQGENDTTLAAHRDTLLYFAGSFNFGVVKREGQAITLFTLGRIFEQSITELEALEAEADNKESLTVISKRKRDGVYYTPEWVVERVVAETLGPRLDDIRTKLGWNLELEGDEAKIKEQLAQPPSKRSAVFNRHVEGVRRFRERLETFTVLDPACGSGAFLIHTLEYLLRERQRVERELALVTSGKGVELFEFKPDDAIRSILSSNIFGVDINPASVEIARLALWLHTAKSDQPLTNLDANIVTGNSLVGPEVFSFKTDLLTATEEKRETINAFDFKKTFASIFDDKRTDGSGFDCIVGNPPYVKLQNFKKVYPETAEYLRDVTGAEGPLYRSCQTGNFDLYLPFIEHGLSLLNVHGRLGYIAPSVWRFNEYGAGLRALVKKRRALDRWIDFGSFQVFDEAITYTALQFYSNEAAAHIQIALAPDGALANIPDWDDPSWRISYAELRDGEPWVFASRPVLDLLHKLRTSSLALGDPTVTDSISQGLISGAFDVFALGTAKRGELKIESDAIRPLISASDIDRFVIHKPDLSIIFPYEFSSARPKLISEASVKKSWPNTYKHLKSNEAALRKRDANQFSVGGAEADRWYAYSRNQNLDKQNRPKIVIAGTGTRIEAALDADGLYAANDKRVYSVFPTHQEDLEFLTGLLNSRLATFVFRLVARPKDGGYYDIETQFLRPIPVPKANKTQKAKVAGGVNRLTKLTRDYSEVLADINHRLAACTVEEKSRDWLWPSAVKSIEHLKTEAPDKLKSREKTAWARNQHKLQVAAQIDLLTERLRPGIVLTAEASKGEMKLQTYKSTILNGVFIDPADEPMTLVSWRHFLRSRPNVDATVLSDGLRKIYRAPSDAVTKQLARLDQQAVDMEAQLQDEETKLDELIYETFELTPEEIELIEKGQQ